MDEVPGTAVAAREAVGLALDRASCIEDHVVRGHDGRIPGADLKAGSSQPQMLACLVEVPPRALPHAALQLMPVEVGRRLDLAPRAHDLVPVHLLYVEGLDRASLRDPVGRRDDDGEVTEGLEALRAREP
jgi:hypothetical protein